MSTLGDSILITVTALSGLGMSEMELETVLSTGIHYRPNCSLRSNDSLLVARAVRRALILAARIELDMQERSIPTTRRLSSFCQKMGTLLSRFLRQPSTVLVRCR